MVPIRCSARGADIISVAIRVDRRPKISDNIALSQSDMNLIQKTICRILEPCLQVTDRRAPGLSDLILRILKVVDTGDIEQELNKRRRPIPTQRA
jgi:hypothetical protein